MVSPNAIHIELLTFLLPQQTVSLVLVSLLRGSWSCESVSSTTGSKTTFQTSWHILGFWVKTGDDYTLSHSWLKFYVLFHSFSPSVVSPKFETIMEDVDVHIGETCRLAVVVEGKPDPDIMWFKVWCLRKLSSVMFFSQPEYLPESVFFRRSLVV